MTVRAVTNMLLIEGSAHGIPALSLMSRWGGLSVILCRLLPNAAIAPPNDRGRCNAATVCSMESGRPERAEWDLHDTDENASSDVVDAKDWTDVRASRGGDGPAYARLVSRYQRPIATYLWRFTRDRNELEELVQEVFVEAYLGLTKFAGRAPFLHWLKRIATRVGYRFWRHRRQRQRELALAEGADFIAVTADGVEEARHAAEVVHLLLAELKPRDRLVLTLAYLEDCDVKEIARLTGWSATMVKVQSYRARRRFAKICEQRGIEL
jgi:RNA polymerase sigma-70 factor, ECF subfamily